MDPGITEASKNEPKKRGGPTVMIVTLLDVVHNYVHCFRKKITLQ